MNKDVAVGYFTRYIYVILREKEFIKWTILHHWYLDCTTESAVIIILSLSLFCLSFLNCSRFGRDLQPHVHVQSVPTTAKVMSLNHVDDEVYLI